MLKRDERDHVLRVGLLSCTELKKRVLCCCGTSWAWISHVATHERGPLLSEYQREAAIVHRVRVNPENQPDQAGASLRRCLKLLPWHLAAHPSKTWSSDTPVSAHFSLAAVVALASAWRCASWSAGTSRHRHVCILICHSAYLVAPSLLSVPRLRCPAASAFGAISTVTAHNFPS